MPYPGSFLGDADFFSLLVPKALPHGGGWEAENFGFYEGLESWKQPFLEEIYIKLTVSVIGYA